MINQKHHSKNCKTVKKVVIRKLEKSDYLRLKPYRVILLNNYIFKVIEKIITIGTTKSQEETMKLYKKQIEFRAKRSILDIQVETVYRMEQVWKKNKHIF